MVEGGLISGRRQAQEAGKPERERTTSGRRQAQEANPKS